MGYLALRNIQGQKKPIALPNKMPKRASYELLFM